MSGKQIDDGGPAFPITSPIAADGYPAAGYPHPSTGLSVRDWFAGMAIQSLAKTMIAKVDHREDENGERDTEFVFNALYSSHEVARHAYDLASQMIKVREIEGEEL